MEPFDHAVRLRVVGRSQGRVDAQSLERLRPYLRGELGSPVRGNRYGDAIARDPRRDKSGRRCFSFDVRQRANLRPARCSVDHREEIAVAFAFRKRPNDIEVNM